MQEEESSQENLEAGFMFRSILGLVFGSGIIILALLLCACFKKARGKADAEEHKNGNIFGSSRHSTTLETEFEEDGLKGARATSHRRLPDLPDPLLNGSENPVVRHSSVRSSQDTSSELYAQVEIGALTNPFPVNTNLNEDLESLRISATTFITQTEEVPENHPYDKVKSNHGYSKIKKKAENPYAKVKRSDTMESEPAEADENETDTDNYDVVYTMRVLDETRKPESSPNGAAVIGANNDSAPPPLPLPLRGSHSSLASSGESSSHGPRPPPRGRRGHSIILSHTSSNGNIHRPHSLISSDQDVAEPDSIDGSAVVQDDVPLEVRGAGAAQVHFSGDSQTSQDSKGYSSISVREPLANLKASNPGVQVGRQRTGSSAQQHRHTDSLDPHYATVSDAEDSDEMYAAIAELQPIYDGGAGSDTYAKINERSEAISAASNSGIVAPVVPTAAAVLTLPSPASPTAPYFPPETERISPTPVPPTPPSVVSLKQLSTGSSRLHASTLSIASQTSIMGSPKPEKRQANSPLPPPPVPLDLIDNLDRSRKSMNVEEMYAKVMKKKGFSVHPWAGETGAGKMQAHRGSVDLGFLVSREGESLSHNPSRRNSMDSTPQSLGMEVNDNAGHQVGEASLQEIVAPVVEEDDEEDDFRYEMLPTPRKKRISETDPGYEKIQLKSGDSFNDPRYERIHLRNDGEAEPNYEVVGFRRMRLSESSEPGYEIVELHQNPSSGFSRQDPNYESLHYSVHHIISDPPYASIAIRDDDFKEGELEVMTEEVTAELVVNNNTVGIPVYAQVIKSKKVMAQTNVVSVMESPLTPPDEVDPSSPISIEDQDYSVSSSNKNTTIIRISTDNRPPIRYFTDEDSFGVEFGEPEQV